MLCHLRKYALYTYIVKEVVSSELGELMGVGHKRIWISATSSR